MSALDDRAFPHHETTSMGEPFHEHLGMSLRQYAAIHLRVPDSGIHELDAMIRQARRHEMVGRALQGLLACSETAEMGAADLIFCSISHADAAIKAMEGKE